MSNHKSLLFIVWAIIMCSTCPSEVIAKSRLPVSDSEIREKKGQCYADIESGLWGWQCKSSMIAKENCALQCLSPACYELVYESDPLEEGEKDFTRGQEYKYCMHRRTKRTINVYWEGIKHDVKDYVTRCEIYQQSKYAALAPAGLLEPLPLPTLVWNDISMDFIGSLPKSRGFNTIMVVVDRLTKYSHFCGLSHPLTTIDVAKIFVREVVLLHGLSASIVSNRDRIFVSTFWSELFRLRGTRLWMSFTYHPLSDGQREVTNHCPEAYLHCFSSSTPKAWVDWLSWAEYWFYTTFHSAAGMSPFKALYGRNPPPLFCYSGAASRLDAVQQLLEQRNAVLDELHEHLKRTQERMKIAADEKRELEFSVGEKVFLCLQPFKLCSLAKRVNEKLSQSYKGPFTILEHVGAVAYWLDLPLGCKVHLVIHIFQLKKVLGSAHIPQIVPSFLTDELELAVQPRQVMAICLGWPSGP